MATGFDPFASSRLSVPVAAPDSSGVAEMLDAMLAVCGAQQAGVVSIDEDMHHGIHVAYQSVAGGAYAGHQPVASEIRDLAFDLGTAVSAKSPTSIALRLARRGRERFYLLLRFQSELATSRARAMACLPKLTQALTRMLDTETQRLAMERERTAATAALNQAHCGVIAATAEGRPVIVNEAASAMIARGEWLHLRRGLVRPVHHADAMRFQAALDTAAPDAQSHDAVARPAAILLLRPRNPSQQPIVVTVAPAGSAKTAGQDEEEAAVIIHIVQPDADAAHGLEPVCELLGLSRVETKLVQQLHRGSTLTEAASVMRIKVDTARSYLKQIFSKTDTHRQADLLALVTRHLRAVRGRFSFRSL